MSEGHFKLAERAFQDVFTSFQDREAIISSKASALQHARGSVFLHVNEFHLIFLSCTSRTFFMPYEICKACALLEMTVSCLEMKRKSVS